MADEIEATVPTDGEDSGVPVETEPNEGGDQPPEMPVEEAEVPAEVGDNDPTYEWIQAAQTDIYGTTPLNFIGPGSKKYIEDRFRAQHVIGEYETNDPEEMNIKNGLKHSDRGFFIEIVGNGQDPQNRSNARALDWNGNEYLRGTLTIGAGTENEVTLRPGTLKKIIQLLDIDETEETEGTGGSDDPGMTEEPGTGEVPADP